MARAKLAKALTTASCRGVLWLLQSHVNLVTCQTSGMPRVTMKCEEDMKTSVGSIPKAARESSLLCKLGHPSLDLWHWSVDPVGQAGWLATQLPKCALNQQVRQSSAEGKDLSAPR